MKHIFSPFRCFRNYAWLLLIGTLYLGACGQTEPKAQGESDKPSPTAPKTGPTKRISDVPDYVLEVLNYVRQNKRAPESYVGGRVFENRERRLPETDPSGRSIRYREWDVHPKVKGQNRGAERLVTGDDQSAWYTHNHYKNFKRIE